MLASKSSIYESVEFNLFQYSSCPSSSVINHFRSLKDELEEAKDTFV